MLNCIVDYHSHHFKYQKEDLTNFHCFIQVYIAHTATTHNVVSADCLQTLPWWQEKSFYQSRSKYSWCKDTHNLKQYIRSHSKWLHGKTMVTLTEAPLLDSHPQTQFTTPRNSLLKFTRPTLESPRRLELDVAGYSKFIFLVVRAFCVYLLASRCECVVWRDKDAGKPHPSTYSDINRYSAHACTVPEETHTYKEQPKSILW